MIRKLKVDLQSYVESQEEFFKEFQKTVSETLVSNSKRVIVDPNEPKEVTDARYLVSAINERFNAEETIVIPGSIIQWIIPKKEILITLLFIRGVEGLDGKKENKINININPLTTMRPEVPSPCSCSCSSPKEEKGETPEKPETETPVEPEKETEENNGRE